jgi:hypothetical protein
VRTLAGYNATVNLTGERDDSTVISTVVSTG